MEVIRPASARSPPATGEGRRTRVPCRRAISSQVLASPTSFVDYGLGCEQDRPRLGNVDAGPFGADLSAQQEAIKGGRNARLGKHEAAPGLIALLHAELAIRLSRKSCRRTPRLPEQRELIDGASAVRVKRLERVFS